MLLWHPVNSIIFNELKAQPIRCLVQVFWKIIFGKKHLNILHSLILIQLFRAPSKPSKGQVGELEIILKAPIYPQSMNWSSTLYVHPLS